MLPPLFPQEVKQTFTSLSTSLDSTLRPPVEHSYGVIRSSLWMLGGIFAVVFGGLVLVMLGIASMSSNGNQSSAAPAYAGETANGSVYGSWTDQYLDEPDVTESSLFDAPGLHESIEALMKEFPGVTYGVVVAPVGSGQQVRINDSHVFTAASTTKLLTASYILAGIDAGRYTYDQIAYTITPTPQPEKEGEGKETEDEQGPAASPSPTPSSDPSPTPIPAPTPEPIKVTVREALQLMVNRSNNQAWEQLIKLAGARNLQAYAEKLGMMDYKVQGNEVSARDLALLLQRLHKGKLLSTASTEQLQGWMQETNEERMLPAGIDELGRVYHKYGWLGSVLHDVGVIENNGSPVVVVLMTDGTQGYDQGTELLRRMAETVEQAVKNSPDSL